MGTDLSDHEGNQFHRCRPLVRVRVGVHGIKAQDRHEQRPVDSRYRQDRLSGQDAQLCQGRSGGTRCGQFEYAAKDSNTIELILEVGPAAYEKLERGGAHRDIGCRRIERH